MAMIAIVTATYLRNGCYHVEDIEKVSRYLRGVVELSKRMDAVHTKICNKVTG